MAGLVAEHGAQLDSSSRLIARELTTTIGCWEPTAAALATGNCVR